MLIEKTQRAHEDEKSKYSKKMLPFPPNPIKPAMKYRFNERPPICPIKLNIFELMKTLYYQSLTRVNASMPRLSADVERQASLESYHTKLLADKTDALRTIEAERLEPLRSLKEAVTG